jgi:hypothetical protein
MIRADAHRRLISHEQAGREDRGGHTMVRMRSEMV